MTDTDDDFFEGKRPWSIIKDQVLKDNISPYLAKVKTLQKPIVLFDGYAGPGVFEDNEPGSPLIMCQAAEKTTPGNYRAFFVNKRAKHHNKLESILLPGISVDRLSGRLFPRGLLVPVALPKPLIGTFTTRTAQLAQIFCTAPNVKTA